MNAFKIYRKINAFFEEENVLNYRPGGYHPIMLGDTLKEGRYKICHKLGYGGFATVWVAKDNELEQWVSIKISQAIETNQSQELNNLRALSEQSGYSEYIVQLFDDFLHEGPNGCHQCLVFELLAPTIDSVIYDYFLDKERLHTEDILDLSTKLLQAIAFMHKAGYAHGDLSVKNLAFTCNSLSHLSKKPLFKMLGSPKLEKLIRLDGEPLEKGVPNRLITSAEWDGWPVENDEDDEDIRIIDLGNSFFQDAIPEELAQPRNLQAPETILADKFDKRVDLWNAGLIIYFLIFGAYPFGWYSDEDLIDSMIDFRGELPLEWQPKWEQLKFNAKKNFERTEDEQISESLLERRFRQSVHEPELQILLSVIKGLTEFLPSDRISALQALNLIEESREKNNKEGDDEEGDVEESDDEEGDDEEGDDGGSDDADSDNEESWKMFISV